MLRPDRRLPRDPNLSSVVDGDSTPPDDDDIALLADDEQIQEADRYGILVVDDDEDFVDSLRDLIELDDRFRVYAATDIATAVQAVQKTAPAIALVDVKLGTEDGLDLIPLLKRIHPSLSCIVMTAYRDPDHARKAFDSGADEFLHKPLDPAGLLRSLHARTSGNDND